VTRIEQLDQWLATGRLRPEQHAALASLTRRERLSVFVELNALLYLGVLAFVAGLAWTAGTHSEQWGDVAILVPSTSLLIGCCYYAFRRAPPYSPDQVAAPTLAFDYVLYLACLIFAVELGYIEYRFHLLRDQWDTWLLISAMAYLALAYRFDNRFVLSLGIASLGGWFGVRFSHLVVVVNEPFRAPALIYGGVVAAMGTGLYRLHIKRHFLETHLHVAANVVLSTLVSGVIASPAPSFWTLALLAVASGAAVAGVRFRRFAFVVYGVVYGYIGVSREILRGADGATATLAYLLVSAGVVIVGLVVLSRRFGREA
jgi:hypothetical protein